MSRMSAAIVGGGDDDDLSSILTGPIPDDISVADTLNEEASEVDRLNYIDEESAEKEYVTHSKLYLDAMKSVEQLQARLVRRSGIIAEMRKHYLRDIVAVKNIVNDVITSDERQIVLKAYTQGLPSLDMTQPLALYGPHNCDLDVKPCNECGGYVEIIVKDSEEMDRLNKVLSDCRDREGRFRLTLGELDARLENITREKTEAIKKHNDEVWY